jgi:uncharacterized membrane protein YfcA
MVFLIAGLIGLLAGLSSGFFGIGGGVIIVPLLSFFLGLTQTEATATSLAALLLPVGALGVWTYWRAGQLSMQNIYIALILAAGLMVGALFGSRFALVLPQDLLRKVFAILLIVMAVWLWPRR